jgi:hypothetical protein
MLPLLLDKSRKQFCKEEQPEAFLSVWRFLHQLLRSFYIEKVGSVIDQTRQPYQKSSLAEWAHRINNAREKELFTKLSLPCTGVELAKKIASLAVQEWSAYEICATQVRHYLSHGKVIAGKTLQGKSLEDLTELLFTIVACVDSIFAQDTVYEAIRKGCPLRPFTRYSYDPKTRRVMVDIMQDMSPPPYANT